MAEVGEQDWRWYLTEALSDPITDPVGASLLAKAVDHIFNILGH
jgi:hypothetical protein